MPRSPGDGGLVFHVDDLYAPIHFGRGIGGVPQLGLAVSDSGVFCGKFNCCVAAAAQEIREAARASTLKSSSTYPIAGEFLYDIWIHRLRIGDVQLAF